MHRAMSNHHHLVSCFVEREGYLTTMTHVSRPVSASSFTFALAVLSLMTSSSSIPLESHSIRLIHRDALESLYVRVGNALLRSASLSHHHTASRRASPLQGNISNVHGDYLMPLSVGTPGKRMLALIDYTSDLTWVKCQIPDDFDPAEPIFNPSNSSTYNRISCLSELCNESVGGSCPSLPNAASPCLYTVPYQDGSSTTGFLSNDTIKYGSSFLVPNSIFGCGNERHYDESGMRISALVSLGNGKFSLISQAKNFTRGIFSLCFAPINVAGVNSSRIIFGPNSKISGSGAITLPLQKTATPSYCIKLMGISVGMKRLNASLTGRGTDIILGSATMLTTLPSKLYHIVEVAVRQYVKLPPANDPNAIVSRCYNTTRNDFGPNITMHFDKGDVSLGHENSYIRVAGDVSCLAFAATTEDAIYGTLAQVNFWVNIDQLSRTVSFKSTSSCANI